MGHDPGQALLEENAALKAALSAAQTRSQEITAELAVARAKASEDLALIAAQKLQIAKLQHQVYG
jgi:transposase